MALSRYEAAPVATRRSALWLALPLFFFFNSPLLFPLRALVVAFHEWSHAIAAVMTGGRIVEMSLDIGLWGEGGRTLTEGGWRFVILNAGYVGSLLFGVGLLLGGDTPGRARAMSLALSGLLLFGGVLYYPWISLGFLYTLCAAGTFFWLGRRASPAVAALGVRVVGVFSVLYAVLDVVSDVLSSPLGAIDGAGGERVTDATMLATLTGVPAVLWGLAWILASLWTLWKLRRHL